MTKVDVTVSDLTAGARLIDACGERIGRVSSAASTAVGLDVGAFGVLCSFLVPVVQTQQSHALSMLTEVGKAVQAESRAVRGAATAYSTVDASCADALAALAEKLG